MRRFPPPNPVSLTALVGGDERVREAIGRAIRVALDQLEHYTQGPIAAIIRPRLRASLSPQSSNTIPAALSMARSRRNYTRTLSFFNDHRAGQRHRPAVQRAEPLRSQQFGHCHLSIRVDLQNCGIGYEINDRESGAPENQGLHAGIPRRIQPPEPTIRGTRRTGSSGKKAGRDRRATVDADRQGDAFPGPRYGGAPEAWADFGIRRRACCTGSV